MCTTMVATPDISITYSSHVEALMAPAVATYDPRDPSDTVLYHVIAEHLETFLDSLDHDPEATGLPGFAHLVQSPGRRP